MPGVARNALSQAKPGATLVASSKPVVVTITIRRASVRSVNMTKLQTIAAASSSALEKLT